MTYGYATWHVANTNPESCPWMLIIFSCNEREKSEKTEKSGVGRQLEENDEDLQNTLLKDYFTGECRELGLQHIYYLRTLKTSVFSSLCNQTENR